MRRLLVAAMMFGALSSARAADLPFLRGGFTDGLSSTTVNWAGFYVGGQGGLGTSDINFTGATRSVAARLLSGTAIENFGGVAEWPLGGKASVHGNGWGGFAGYNWQWDDTVLSAEFSYLHGKFGGTRTDSMSRFFGAGGSAIDSVTYESTATVNITDMATVRARAAYSWGVFLPYGFAGVALGQASIIRTAHIFGDQVNPSLAPPFNDVPFDLSATDAQNTRLIYGYTAGLGMDMMLAACLFMRAEWEYVRYTAAIDTSINTFRVGLGYKF